MRAALRYHPAVVGALRAAWRMVTGDQRARGQRVVDHVDEQTYHKVFERVYHVMCPDHDAGDHEDALLAVREDWSRDCAQAGASPSVGLNQPAFEVRRGPG